MKTYARHNRCFTKSNTSSKKMKMQVLYATKVELKDLNPEDVYRRCGVTTAKATNTRNRCARKWGIKVELNKLQKNKETKYISSKPNTRKIRSNQITSR